MAVQQLQGEIFQMNKVLETMSDTQLILLMLGDLLQHLENLHPAPSEHRLAVMAEARKRAVPEPAEPLFK